jgi:hypothetical protein
MGIETFWSENTRLRVLLEILGVVLCAGAGVLLNSGLLLGAGTMFGAGLALVFWQRQRLVASVWGTIALFLGCVGAVRDVVSGRESFWSCALWVSSVVLFAIGAVIIHREQARQHKVQEERHEPGS